MATKPTLKGILRLKGKKKKSMQEATGKTKSCYNLCFMQVCKYIHVYINTYLL